MFILEREEQLDELLRCWAWRYKRRRLSKVPLPHSPGLSALLHRLCRCGGPSIQEIWCLSRETDPGFIWLEEPAPQVDFQVSDRLDRQTETADVPAFWDWSRPCRLADGQWIYPLLLNKPESPAVTARATGATDRLPPKTLYQISDRSGLWKFGDPLLARFQTPLSLCIRSDHPAAGLFVRKLVAKSFDWQRTLLIDLEDNPLALAGDDPERFKSDRRPSPRLVHDLVHGFCRKLPGLAGDQPVVILCDSISGSFETELITQLLHELIAHKPLFFCLRASDRFAFTWTVSEEIQASRAVRDDEEKRSDGPPAILKQIARLLAIVPDRLSLDQVRLWFGAKERQQLDQCLGHGLLQEKSGQIVIPERLTQSRSEPVPADEQPVLKQAFTLYKAPLTHLKMLLLQADACALRQLCVSPPFLEQLHEQPRQLIALLDQTCPSWQDHTDIVQLMAELTARLFLLPQCRYWLEKIAPDHSRERENDTLWTAVQQALQFDAADLIAWAVNPARAGSGSRVDALKQAGCLSLAVIAETEDLVGPDCGQAQEILIGRMNELLFSSRRLENADLRIWVSLAWAHWQLRHGSPQQALFLLQDCQQLSAAPLPPLNCSLKLCETLLGHWQRPDQAWNARLPGALRPPDEPCWDYLQLLLQHRFTQADMHLGEFDHHLDGTGGDHVHVAGLCPQNMALIRKKLQASHQNGPEIDAGLPPWLEFIVTALRPFSTDPADPRPASRQLPACLLGSERNYFYYEYHYLRFHETRPPILSGAERDLFLDTCAYFSRRGRQLSPVMQAIRSRLAQAVLAESRSSGAISASALSAPAKPADLLKTALGMILSRFLPEICYIRLLRERQTALTVGAPLSHEALAGYLLDNAGQDAEERVPVPVLKTTCPRELSPCLLNLETVLRLRVAATDGRVTLLVLLAYRSGAAPELPLYENLQLCLSPLLDLLQGQAGESAGSLSQPLDAIIGESSAVMELKKQIRRVSRVDFTVTIHGESGTGKELIARAIHLLSRRHAQPFIAFNCAALPETLLEAELFGYQKGAFTDARETRTGLIESAQNGCLFLDEIGEMPLLLQAKLLRFLQDHSLRRLGDNQQRQVDCRIVCATHRDLLDMVKAKTFREDLYYRIHELTVYSPPLRERREDLPLLLDHFIAKYQFQALSPTERHWLALKWMNQDWPGNIRELESRIKELITYYPHHPDVGAPSPARLSSGGTLHSCRSQFERLCILDALERNGWNRVRSASALGISRIALFKLMRKHKIGGTF